MGEARWPVVRHLMCRVRHIDIMSEIVFPNLRTGRLRIGFIPLNDCAPLVMASELGLYGKYGLRVVLERELGWASVRDKVVFGELDGAHAVCGLPFGAASGRHGIPCVAGMVMNQNGNAITLSETICQSGCRSASSIKRFITSRSNRKLTLGIVSRFSSHSLLLNEWLRRGGIDVETDVNIVVVPPSQMPDHLEKGNIDGFCAGEPWNTIAISQGSGRCVATSSDIFDGHPEKVLMVQERFASEREEEYISMIAAVLEACQYCQSKENQAHVISTLVKGGYIRIKESVLENSFSSRLLVPDNVSHSRNFTDYSGEGVNEPSDAKESWILDHLEESGAMPANRSGSWAMRGRVFRDDLFSKAQSLCRQAATAVTA